MVTKSAAPACIDATAGSDLLTPLLSDDFVVFEPHDQDLNDFVLIAGAVEEGVENPWGGRGEKWLTCADPLQPDSETIFDLSIPEFIAALQGILNWLDTFRDDDSLFGDSAWPCRIFIGVDPTDSLRARASANEAFTDDYLKGLAKLRVSACLESALGSERRAEVESAGATGLTDAELDRIASTCPELSAANYDLSQVFIEIPSSTIEPDIASVLTAEDIVTYIYILVDGSLTPIFALDSQGNANSIEGVSTSTTGFSDIGDLLGTSWDASAVAEWGQLVTTDDLIADMHDRLLDFGYDPNSAPKVSIEDLTSRLIRPDEGRDGADISADPDSLEAASEAGLDCSDYDPDKPELNPECHCFFYPDDGHCTGEGGRGRE